MLVLICMQAPCWQLAAKANALCYYSVVESQKSLVIMGKLRSENHWYATNYWSHAFADDAGDKFE